MSTHVIVLDSARHQSFLKQHRRDPVTKRLLEHGDRVVICAGDHCGRAFLEGSWRAVGERHGRHTGTLPDIEVEALPTQLGEAGREPPTSGQARPGRSQAGNAPVPQYGTAAGGAEPGASAGPEPLRLREIPFRLREIPFDLRQVAAF